MLHPETLAAVCHCPQELYGCLGHRQDSFCQLTDAVLTGTERTPLARLSLDPAFRRRWPSTCDALADNTRSLFHANLARPAGGERPLWALAGTHWPRPAALTSPERAYERRVATGQPRDGVVPAWAYQGLVAVPAAHGSRALPLDVRRCGPGIGLPARLAIGQRQAALAEHAAEAARRVVPLDPSYDASVPAQAHLPASLLVRLAKRCRFFRC